jgi:hypothetical protein
MAPLQPAAVQLLNPLEAAIERLTRTSVNVHHVALYFYNHVYQIQCQQAHHQEHDQGDA